MSIILNRVDWSRLRRQTRLVATVLVGAVAAAMLLVGVDATPAAAASGYSPACYWQGYEGLGVEKEHGVDAYRLANGHFNQDGYCEIGKTLLIMQTDGNLVVYDENAVARWAASWTRPGVLGHGDDADFQTDGNLVVYDYYRNALWASNTCCWPGNATLAVQADGNVVIYNSSDNPIWATNTAH